MRARLHILLFVVLTLSSCGTSRYYAGFTKEAAKSAEMALLGPASLQFYLDKDNRETYSDSLSLVSKALITRIVTEDLASPVSPVIQLDSVGVEESVAFMRYVFGLNAKLVGDLPIPGLLDDLLEQSGKRFGLLIYAEGMTRDMKGYAKDVAKGILLGAATSILSGGTAVTLFDGSGRFASRIFAAVLDSETDHIVFMNAYAPQENLNPLNYKHVREQLNIVLKDFWGAHKLDPIFIW